MKSRNSKFSIALHLLLACAIVGCNESNAPFKLAPQEFETKLTVLNNEQLVDVRTPQEYNSGHLTGAININFQDEDFKDQISKLDKTIPTLVYCAAGVEGGRSNTTSKMLEELGFDEIYELEGGITNWTNAGKETQK